MLQHIDASALHAIRGTSSSADRDFLAALTSGGDSRLVVGAASGVNKYLCPAVPSSDLLCASSCTASPITWPGLHRAAAVFDGIAGATTASDRQCALVDAGRRIEAGLVGYFGAAGLAEAILCPSGTDAILTAALLLAEETPGRSITSVIPASAETGTGVPLAVTCREFDGPSKGRALIDGDMACVEVAIRRPDGRRRVEDAVAAAFTLAAWRARGRSIAYLTHGTKTGLVVPAGPLSGEDVVVDACQGRIDPACVAGYLRRGWPVAVTGSKFFGGPAFSGAVLFPTARRLGAGPAHGLRWRLGCRVPDIGTVLRWAAALDGIERFAPLADTAASVLRAMGSAIREAIAANPALVAIDGLISGDGHWSAEPSIFTFAVRDPEDPGRLLSPPELRRIYERLASDGILLGQPVGLGSFGGLRVAIGARDIINPCPAAFDALLSAVKVLDGRPHEASVPRVLVPALC